MPLSAPAAIVFYFYIPFIIWDIFIFSKYIYKMYYIHTSKTRKLSLLQQVLHNTCLSAIILTSIFDMLHGFGAMITNTELLGLTSLAWVTDMEILADVFYYTNSLLLYIILIHRLFKTFSNTAFAISNWFYYWISFQIIFQAFLMTVYLLILSIDNCRHQIWCKRLGLTASLITANDYVLNIILFSLFVKKLRQLIVTKLSSEIFEYQNDESDEDYDEESREMTPVTPRNMAKALDNNANNNLLTLITKQTVIGTFVTLTNQAFATCIFIVFTFESAQKADSLVMIAYLLRGGEGAFICFLLYIGLGMNSDDYMRMCKWCHKACYNLCINVTTRNVDKAVVNDDYVRLQDM